MKKTCGWMLALVGCLSCSSGTDEKPEGQEPVPFPSIQVGDERPPRTPRWVARQTRVRLFGTQKTDSGWTATLADTRTWDTRTHAQGESLGRDVILEHVDENGVSLVTPSGRVQLKPGEEHELSIVRDEVELAASYLGRHQWLVNPALLREVHEAYGFGVRTEPVELASEPWLKLTQVEANGMASRLGLQSGDILVDIEGGPATHARLQEWLGQLTESTAQVRHLRVMRGPSAWEARYQSTVERPQ